MRGRGSWNEGGGLGMRGGGGLGMRGQEPWNKGRGPWNEGGGVLEQGGGGLGMRASCVARLHITPLDIQWG